MAAELLDQYIEDFEASSTAPSSQLWHGEKPGNTDRVTKHLKPSGTSKEKGRSSRQSEISVQNHESGIDTRQDDSSAPLDAGSDTLSIPSSLSFEDDVLMSDFFLNERDTNDEKTNTHTLESLLEDFRKGLSLPGVRRKGMKFDTHETKSKVMSTRTFPDVEKEYTEGVAETCQPYDVVRYDGEREKRFEHVLQTERWTMKWDGEKCVFVHRVSGETTEEIPDFDIERPQQVAFRAALDALRTDQLASKEQFFEQEAIVDEKNLDREEKAREQIQRESINIDRPLDEVIQRCFAHLQTFQTLTKEVEQSTQRQRSQSEDAIDLMALSTSSFVIHAGLPTHLWQASSP